MLLLWRPLHMVFLNTRSLHLFKILSVGTKPYQCWYQCLSVALFPFPFSYPACVTRTKEFLNASFISWNSVKKPFTECSQNLLCRVISHPQCIASIWLEEERSPFICFRPLCYFRIRFTEFLCSHIYIIPFKSCFNEQTSQELQWRAQSLTVWLIPMKFMIFGVS